jgi:predicted TIM-barrel fold metal-dependent hydrolase
MVDTHTHAWGPETDGRPWVNDALVDRVHELPVGPVYTAEDLLSDMDEAGVDEAVLVGFPICRWEDNGYTIQAVEAHDRLSGIGLVDPFAEDAADQLEALLSTDGVFGVRLGPLFPREDRWNEDPTPESTWLRDAIDERAFWERARSRDATIQLLVHHTQLDQVADLVETYPDLTYVIDHLARADPSLAPDGQELAPLWELAGEHGVFVKVSAVAFLSEEEFPYRDVHAHLRHGLDTVGREGLLWGSDYPYVSDVASYEETRSWLVHVETLSETDRRWLCGRTFDRHVRTD